MRELKLNIAVGVSAHSQVWRNQTINWSDLCAKLSEPVITKETMKQYASLSKEDKLHIKDVGGFIGGTVLGGKRTKRNVSNRQIITLDADNAYTDLWFDFINLYDCCACMHSTHSSTPAQPRYRLIIPVNREISAEEYEAIARRIASDIGMTIFDGSTYQVNRLMFWPSVPKDAEYVYVEQAGPVLDADKILATYADWHDITSWPTLEGESLHELVEKQQDPTQKNNIVGLFCRAYSIQEAIKEFLPDIYIEAAIDGRYTYAKGTTAAGAIVYDDMFIYSHHNTDPASGKLCNAFDLVRIHKFGYLDKKSDGDKVPDKMASYKAMENFVSELPEIKKQLAAERLASAKNDFTEIEDNQQEDDLEWTKEMTITTKGEYEVTSSNIVCILKNDPNLKGRFSLSSFDNKRYVKQSLPWRKLDGIDIMRDVDYAGVRNYVEHVYGIASPNKVDDALALEFERNKFHPIIDYLEALKWDGKCRVETLFCDYFGAEDTEYMRSLTRKVLCAAIARVYKPGTKFDSMPVIVGPQGLYKSTFVHKLAKDWFSDTFMGVQGKEAFEQLQGAWIIEVAELSAFKHAEIESIKHFLSKCEDTYRPAYGRVVETFKRQCILIGTNNKDEFLNDSTGNRRFLPIDARPDYIRKSVVKDFDDNEVDQVWAEALQMYRADETLYMQGTALTEAIAIQTAHTEIDDRQGIVLAYLDRLYPENWDTMSSAERDIWLNSNEKPKKGFTKQYTCALEIYCECLGGNISSFSRKDAKIINDMLRLSHKWIQVTSTRVFPIYGTQRFFKRIEDLI